MLGRCFTAAELRPQPWEDLILNQGWANYSLCFKSGAPSACVWTLLRNVYMSRWMGQEDSQPQVSRDQMWPGNRNLLWPLPECLLILVLNSKQSLLGRSVFVGASVTGRGRGLCTERRDGFGVWTADGRALFCLGVWSVRDHRPWDWEQFNAHLFNLCITCGISSGKGTYMDRIEVAL